MKFIIIVISVLIFLFGTFIAIVSTANKAHLSPDTLPVAYLNEPYEAKMEIVGGAVIPEMLHYEVSEPNFKLEPKTYTDIIDPQHSVLRHHYNELTLKGTPTTLTPITVHISGSTYGTNFSGKKFEKTYTIEVK